ncbi:MAG: NPCBM/NEW2 domain-containing protein [Planctomycetia bacterium]|nr:NPCBM/NEW2 domain-containing protein [Planctomycetia bacterium]
MFVGPLVLLAALLQLPATEIETLKGDRQAGELVELNDTAALLKQGDKTVSVPMTSVLEVKFPATVPVEPAISPRIVLADGSRITAGAFSVAGEKVRCESSFGTLTFPVPRLSSVRFGESTSRLDDAWKGLLARESTSDLLIVRNEDVLDFLAGVSGDVGEKVHVLLDGDDVPVAREKVYGIIYHRRVPSLPKNVCQVKLAGGDVLEAAQISFGAGAARVRLAAGVDAIVPQAQLVAIDFSPSKIKYLSDLKPRDVKYVPFWEIFLYEYRRDRSLDGAAIMLKGKNYPRGLAMHSKTTLRFRIAGEYTRFLAIAGIDDSVAQLGHAVQLTITGDGKPLLDAEIKGREAPRPLDLDVTGVRDLEIVCDFGSDISDIGDHLDLADAKLVK